MRHHPGGHISKLSLRGAFKVVGEDFVKNRRNDMSEWGKTRANWYMALVILALAMSFAGSHPSRLSAQDTQEKLNPQDLKEIIAKAKTPADHEKLAAYYKQEASQLQENAELHRADANIYGKGQGLIHCTNLAKYYEQAAKEADALATMHENMAKAAAH
jgi:hypothetical protein